MTDSKFKCNIFLFLSVTVFMARLSILRRLLLTRMVEIGVVSETFFVLNLISDLISLKILYTLIIIINLNHYLTRI
jgi:hypothetical protein